MTVRELLAELQQLPRDAELLAFEAGCEEYCEREVDEIEWQGGRCTCISAPDATTRPDTKPAGQRRERGLLAPSESISGFGLDHFGQCLGVAVAAGVVGDRFPASGCNGVGQLPVLL
jgi:hypothetical protein